MIIFCMAPTGNKTGLNDEYNDEDPLIASISLHYIEDSKAPKCSPITVATDMYHYHRPQKP